MINHQYTLERGRQADQSRSMSTPSIKTGYLPRKDKVCLQPVKTNIVILDNIYDFDWYVQVTSVVCFKIPTSRDTKQKRRKLYCWRCWRLRKTILACSKSAKTVSSSELTLICLGQKQIIVRKPKSNTLTISVWQKTKNNLRHTSSQANLQRCLWNSYALRLCCSGKRQKHILSVMENSFLFLKQLVELSKEALFG